jgi:hypothetical protein
LPTGGDRGLARNRRGLEGPIRGGTAGVAWQVCGPEVKKKAPRSCFNTANRSSIRVRMQ